MKLMGIVIIVASAGSVGFGIASSLKKRCALLRKLLSALQILKNEITFCATPLPQAFALIAASMDGMTARVFSAAAKDMDRRRWLTPQAALEKALEQESVDAQLRDTLCSLGAGLGKYDRDEQARTIDLTQLRLEELLRNAERERSVRSKTYETLGICAGLALAILLI